MIMKKNNIIILRSFLIALAFNTNAQERREPWFVMVFTKGKLSSEGAHSVSTPTRSRYALD